jgi:streptogramin lyase
MSRLVAVISIVAALLGAAPLDRAEAKGNGPHALVASPSGVFAATGDGLVHRLDPGCDCVTDSRRLGGFPVALAARAETLWVIAAPRRGPSRLHRLAAATLEPKGGPPVTLAGRPSTIAAGQETLWLAGWAGRTLRGLDPSTGRTVHRIELPRGIASIAVGGERLWVALYGRRPDPRVGRRRGPGSLLSLDAATGRRGGGPRGFAGRPWDLVADARGAWLRTGYRVVLGFEPGRGIRRRLRLDGDIAGLALDPRFAWVQAQSRGELVRVEREDGSRRRMPARLDVFPSALATGHGSVWAADLLTRAVVRVDARDGRIAARIPLPHGR